MDKKKDLGVVFTPKILSECVSKKILYYYLLENCKELILIKDLIFKQKPIKNPIVSKKLLKLLKEIKILEPALGEGSLIIEMFKLLVKLIILLEDKSVDLLEIQKKLIKNSLFGYEIRKKYLDVAKSNFLELVLSSDLEFNFQEEDFLKLNLEGKIEEKFDLIIANPPYIKEKENKELFTSFNNTEYYQARMDIWYLFMQYSIELLKPNGVTTFIIPNNWTTNAGASKLRDSIFNKTKILSIRDFDTYQVFESASIQTMVLTLKKESVDTEYKYDYLKKNKELDIKLDDFLSNSKMNKITFNSKLSYLIFTSHEINHVLSKIVNKANFKLLKIKEVSQGIVHPQNTVSKANVNIEKGYKLNRGIFVITNEEKKELKLNRKELNIVKPTYKTTELKKYFKIGKPRFWTIYTDKTFNNIKKIEKYPNVKKHLDQFQEIMTSEYKPYGLHRTRNEYFFKKGPKILVARKSQIPTFTYLEEECYPTFTFNVIKSERINLKYLTMLLNSKLIAFYLKYQGKMQGKNFQIDIAPLINLPISINDSKYNELICLYDKLVENKKNNKEVNQKIINESNHIIYLIYGLNDKEIDIVEKDIEESYGKYFKTQT